MAIDIRGMAPLLQVFDMPGFEIVTTDGKPAPNCDWVLLRLADAELMLNTAYERDQRPAKPDPARISAHEDVGLYFGCPDVDGAYSHLCSLGIEAKEPTVAPYGMKQLYLKDPDGYDLCFQWRADSQK